MSESENRRSGFRLDDTMKIYVKTVDAADNEGILANFDEYRMRCCLKSHLRNQAELRIPKLQLIRKRDPEIADYLSHLEAQIVQLASRTSSNSNSDGEFDEMHEEVAVNISATGLRFMTELELEPGQEIELGMMLSTSGIQMVTLAEVLRVETQESLSESVEQRHLISAHFTSIHIDDREAIIRHMAKLQQLQLHARRAQ